MVVVVLVLKMLVLILKVIDLDFGNEKTKVVCIEDTTGVNGNSNDNGSPDDADDVGNNDN